MTTTEQKNTEAVIAYIADLWNRGELERTEQFFASQLAEAFTERSYVVDEIFAQGEKVVARLLIAAKHTGSFVGSEPTDKEVAIAQFREFRVEEGRVDERFRWFDTGTLLQQIQPG